jgi:hypothetical protein
VRSNEQFGKSQGLTKPKSTVSCESHSDAESVVAYLLASQNYITIRKLYLFFSPSLRRVWRPIVWASISFVGDLRRLYALSGSAMVATLPVTHHYLGWPVSRKVWRACLEYQSVNCVTTQFVIQSTYYGSYFEINPRLKSRGIALCGKGVFWCRWFLAQR